MHRLAAVVPVLNEAESMADVVSGLLAAGACCVYVVDGGSTDGTTARAVAAGAVAIDEPRRGYGQACLTGADAAQRQHPHELIAFLDGDGSCDPAELSLLAAHARHADVVLGIRSRSATERGAYPWHARAGNLLAGAVIGARVGRHARDLPPFKVLRATALARLQLRQTGYALTTELVARALSDRGLKTVEVPISFRVRRGGVSKVSGRLAPSIRAGLQILGAAVDETRARPRLVLMAKRPGRAKSRLATSAGDDVAAGFWTASLTDVATRLLKAAACDGLEARVMLSAADEVAEVEAIVGPAWIADVQERPGLNSALVEVFTRAFSAGAPLAMAVSGDNPTLPESVIHDAVEALRRNEAVIGPTADGGYYLLGLRGSAVARRRGLLRNLFAEPLGATSAYSAATQTLIEDRVSLATLRPWSDVDQLDDLRELAATLADAPEAAPATNAWLNATTSSATGGSDVTQ